MTQRAVESSPAVPARALRPARRSVAGVSVALAAPAAVSLLALGNPHEEVPALLYVLSVLAATTVGGRVPGLVAAAASIVPFYYFFITPYHTWSVKADGALAVAVFAATALLGSEVLARQRGARARAEQEASSSFEALGTAVRLQRAAEALVSARTPEEVLDAVLVEGVRAAEARSGLIAALSEDGEWLEVLASRGYDMRYIEPFQRVRLDGDFPLSEAVRTGEGVFLHSEQERDARYPDLAGRSQPGHGLASMPLVGESGPIGGLVFSFSTDQEFPPERRALKLALARQAALALERARLSAAEEALRERLSFLDEATALLNSSLDLEQTLERLASLAVSRLADWCAIDVLNEGTDEVDRLIVAHQNPERRRWAEAMRARTGPTRLGEEYDLTARVIRTGEPEFLREVPQALLDEAAERDPEAAEVLREISIRSAIALPLRAGERTLGALMLIAEERSFDDDDFALAQQLGARAAIAIDNARLYGEAERRADAALALAYVGDGVVLLDSEGRVRFWNTAAAAITGVRGEDAVGRAAEEVLPAWKELTRLAEAPDAAEPERARAVTVPLETPRGDCWVAVTRVGFDEGAVYALRDVTDELALEQARSDFVTTASHELRTPLAAVYGAARTLRRPDLDLASEQGQRLLEIVENETERLTRIVSQILLAGQLEEGRVDLRTEATDLGSLVESVLAAARLGAPEDIELRLAVEDDAALALADEDKLRQVLVNLLDNAIKYSPDGGEVTVELEGRPGRVLVTVRDSGLGIPPGEEERVFEKFYRLDPGQTRGIGGSGLGLYISRELVSRMGGSLTVGSRHGEGAAFVIDLPAA